MLQNTQIIPQETENNPIPQKTESSGIPQDGENTLIPQETESTVSQEIENNCIPHDVEKTMHHLQELQNATSVNNSSVHNDIQPPKSTVEQVSLTTKFYTHLTTIVFVIKYMGIIKSCLYVVILCIVLNYMF